MRDRSVSARARGLLPAAHRSRIRTALAGFGRGERGAAAIESSIAIVILVGAFAGLMDIVNVVLESDRMDRAARAAAHAAALHPSADACAVIRRELHLDEDFDCSAWTITVHQGVLASELADALQAKAPPGSGDMVLVRIDWSRAAWSFTNVLRAAHAAGDDGAAERESATTHIAIGLARCEPVD